MGRCGRLMRRDLNLNLILSRRDLKHRNASDCSPKRRGPSHTPSHYSKCGASLPNSSI